MSHRPDRTFSSTVTALSMLVAVAIPGAALGSEPEGSEYHTGLILSKPERLRSLPLAPVYTDYIPARIDLSSHLPPVGDQGKIGSCAAWATGYAARTYYVAWLEGRDVTKPANIPSPEFIYDSANDKPGDCDNGASIPDIMDMLQNGGTPSLADAPYDDEKMAKAKCVRPDAEENQRKRDFFLESWYYLDMSTLDQIKAELTQGNPVVIGMNIGHSFMVHPQGAVYQGEWKGYYSASYRRRVPDPQQLGGHALAIVGFDDDRQAFKLVNSWGGDWADHGFAWVSYKVALDSDMLKEAYSMRPARPR